MNDTDRKLVGEIAKVLASVDERLATLESNGAAVAANGGTPVVESAQESAPSPYAPSGIQTAYELAAKLKGRKQGARVFLKLAASKYPWMLQKGGDMLVVRIRRRVAPLWFTDKPTENGVQSAAGQLRTLEIEFFSS